MLNNLFDYCKGDEIYFRVIYLEINLNDFKVISIEVEPKIIQQFSLLGTTNIYQIENLNVSLNGNIGNLMKIIIDHLLQTGLQ